MGEKLRTYVFEFLFLSFAVANGVFWGVFWWFVFLLALDFVLPARVSVSG